MVPVGGVRREGALVVGLDVLGAISCDVVAETVQEVAIWVAENETDAVQELEHTAGRRDVYALPAEGIVAAAPHLSDLSELLPGSIASYNMVNISGKVSGIAVSSTLSCLWLRNDILIRHHVDWDSLQSWEDLEEQLLTMQTDIGHVQRDFYTMAIPVSKTPIERVGVFLSLLSAFGGKLREENIGTERALEKWRHWIHRLAPPSTRGMSLETAKRLLIQGKVAVALGTTAWAAELEGEGGVGVYRAVPLFPMEDSAPQVAGVFLGVPKGGNAAAGRFVERVVASLAVSGPSALPLQHLGEVSVEYCKTHSLLCEALKRYTFFDANDAENIPGACGVQYQGCYQAVHTTLTEYFEDMNIPPEEAAQRLRSSMDAVLGVRGVVGVAAEPLKERYAPLLLATILSVVAGLTAVVLANRSNARLAKRAAFLSRGPLRIARRVGIPTAVFFGLVAMILIGVSLLIITLVLLEHGNNRTHDVASIARRHLLIGVKTALEVFHRYTPSSSSTSLLHADTIALLTNTVAAHRINPSSLFIVFDSVDSNVILSTDIARQMTGRTAPTPLLSHCTSLLGVSGESQTADYHLSYETEGSLVLCYFEPNGEHTEVRGEGVAFLVVVCVGVGVVAMVLATVLITRPLAAVGRRLEAGMHMVFEGEIQPASLLSEVTHLQAAVHHVALMLKEYKCFIPESVYLGATSSDEDSDSVCSGRSMSASLHSRSLSHAASLSFHSHSSSRILERRMYGTQLGLHKLSRISRGAVLLVRVENFSLSQGGIFKDVVEAAELYCRSYGGELHAFSSVDPALLVMSFGVVRRPRNAKEKALNTALALSRRCHATARLSLVVRAGDMSVGNIGTTTFRNFTLIGSCLQDALRISHYAGQLLSATGLEYPLILCGENHNLNQLRDRYDHRTVAVMPGRYHHFLFIFQIFCYIEGVERAAWMFGGEGAKTHILTDVFDHLTKPGGSVASAIRKLVVCPKGDETIRSASMTSSSQEGSDVIAQGVLGMLQNHPNADLPWMLTNTYIPHTDPENRRAKRLSSSTRSTHSGHSAPSGGSISRRDSSVSKGSDVR